MEFQAIFGSLKEQQILKMLLAANFMWYFNIEIN